MLLRRSFWVLIAVLGASLAMCPVAAAADATETAQELFQRGEAAFSKGRYEEAANLFQEADSRAPHASVQYNAAVSWELANDTPRAADAYLDALSRGGLNDQQMSEANARLEQLRRELGFVRLTRPAGGLASVAHHQRVELPVSFFLRPGVHQVLLETDAGSSETPITVEPGQSLQVQLQAPVAIQPEPGEPTPAPPPPPPPPVPEDAGTTQRTLGWVGIGIGMVASGAAIYFGSQALAKKDDFGDTRLSNRQRNLARAEAVDMQRNTNLAWGGAAVFGGVGAVLLFTAPTIEF